MRTHCIQIALMLAIVGACSLARTEPPAKPKREQVGEVLGKPVYRDELHSKYPSPTEEDELHRLFLDPALKKYVAAHRAEVEPTQAELAAVEASIEEFGKREQVRQVAEIRESLRLVDAKLAKKDSRFKRDYLLQKKQDMEQMLKAEIAEQPENPLKDNSFVDELAQINVELAKPGLTKSERESLEEAKRVCESALAHPYRMAAQLMYGNWKLQRHFYDRYGGGRVMYQQAGLEAFDAYRRWIESEELKGSFRITDPKLRASFYYYWKRNDGDFHTDPDELRKRFLEPDWVPRTAAR